MEYSIEDVISALEMLRDDLLLTDEEDFEDMKMNFCHQIDDIISVLYSKTEGNKADE